MSSVSSSRFDKMPQDVQRVFASFISLEEIALMAGVSRAFKKTMEDPVIWTKVATHLTIAIVTANPKADVIAHYRAVNEEILQHFDPRNIERNANPFMQRRLIEKYMPTYNGAYAELIQTYIIERHFNAAKFFITRIPFDNFLTLDLAVDSNNIEIVEAVIKYGNGKPGQMVLIFAMQPEKNSFIRKIIIENTTCCFHETLPWTISRGTLGEFMMEKAIDMGCPLSVSALLQKEVVPTQGLIDLALSKNNNEIITLLLGFQAPNANFPMSPQEGNRDKGSNDGVESKDPS